MKNLFACNYSVIRFLPYPETEEFVNIGIVLACPQLRTILYQLETVRRDRITGFFPELNVNVFLQGRKDFVREMDRIVGEHGKHHQSGQMEFQILEKDFINFFKEVTKPRESIFRFGGMGTVMAEEPVKELNRLFAHYVERQFATHEEYQENVMANRLKVKFKASDILKYYKVEVIGNETYKVRLPFVHTVERNKGITKAIKPLHLDKPDSTRILEYGDRWLNRIERLDKMKKLPEQLLFVVHPPKSHKKLDAAEEVIKELKKRHAKVIPEAEEKAILEFARDI